MADIPGIVFQAPGGPDKDAAQKAAKRSAAAQPEETRDAASDEAAARPPAEQTESTEPADSEAADETTADGTSRRRRVSARRGQSQQAFPVHVVKPHPLAFERAQEILESNSSYTKILPGDEPGTVIIR